MRVHSSAATTRHDREVRGGARVSDASGAGALRIWHSEWRRGRSETIQSTGNHESSAYFDRDPRKRDPRLVFTLQRETHFRAKDAEKIRRGN